MRFFVRYSTGKYDGWSFQELPHSEQCVIDFLNLYASNPEFAFEVIEGRRVEFEPVQVATQFRKKL